MAAEYGCEIELLELLTPESRPDQLMPWLEQQREDGTVGMVGHEPHLSSLSAYLLTGRPKSFMELKKGGAYLLELADPPRPGDATLHWLLTGNALRRMND